MECVPIEMETPENPMNDKQVKNILAQFMLIVLAVQLSGCYITKGTVPVVPTGTVEIIPATVSLSIDLSHSFDEERTTGAHNQARTDEVKKISKRVFDEARLFESADYDVFKPDFFLDFKVNEVEKGSAESAMIGGFTLLLVPVKTGADFEVEATLKDKKGKVVGTYTSKGDVDVIIHLIFILPIGWRFNIPTQVYEAIFKDLIAQMAGDRAKILNAMT